jgi:hypothetical protein
MRSIVPIHCLLFCLSGALDQSFVSPASSLGTWGSEVGVVSSAQAYAALTFPYSLTTEVAWAPYKSAVALKWTFTDRFFKNNDVDLALRARYSKGKISDTWRSISGIQVLVSHIYGVVEPYASAGSLKASPDDSNSWQGGLGLNAYPVPFLVLGLEYSRSFQEDVYTGKLSFQFD